MSILNQKTISKKISFFEIEIHSGMKVNLSILPASPNTGLVFKRIDIKKNNLIYPLYNNGSATTLYITIFNEYNVKE